MELEEFYTREIDRLNDEISQRNSTAGNQRPCSSADSSELRSQINALQDRLEIATEQKEQAQKVGIS